MNNLLFLIFGMLFGFLLSRAGATTFDNYAGFFLFTELQLLWVIGVAATVGIIGITLMKLLNVKALFGGQAINYHTTEMRKGLVLGSLLFGVGWGLSGGCPGSAPAMIGEGKLMALFSFAGMMIGTYIYGIQQTRKVDKKQPHAKTGQHKAAS